MKINLKKILKWGGIVFLAWIVIFFSYELFIRNWIIEYSEKRVQKNIRLNYQENKIEFQQLRAFLEELKLNPVTEIEFIDKNIFTCKLSSPFLLTDSIYDNSIPFVLGYSEYDDVIEIEYDLLENGLAKINYLDMVIETHNWSWNFSGSKNDNDFDKFLDYVGITEKELDSLENLIRNANCEAILIHKDNSISLRYDGFTFSQYEYFIPIDKLNNSELRNEVEIDEGLFCGLRQSGLFCGYVIYDK